VLFNSPVFIAFFVCYLIAHCLTPNRYRLWTMIAGSAMFYGYWNWAFAGLPFLLVLLALLATWFTVSADPRQRRFRLAIGVVVLLMPLLFFKYTNFIWTDVIGALVDLEGIARRGKLLTVPLPLGISFVTFTLIAYLVDVSTGKYPFKTSPRWLLGYTLFFPHLIAGPILRPHELIPQLHRGMPVRRGNLLPGMALFTVGLIKKTILADPIGTVVTTIYAHSSGRSAVEYLFAFYGFAVQIYCDFSGYTDMALGTALILGVRLPGNFLRPYLAASIADFWRRWHITLSHWLRDYVYIPLGGGRGGAGKTMRNVMITMAVGGLWHGANWTFLIWGVLHGAGVAGSHLLQRHAPRWMRPPNWVLVLVTFHVVALLWIFFRSPDLTTALTMLYGCLGGASFENTAGFIKEHVFEIALMIAFFLSHPWDDGRRVRIMARTHPPIVVGAVIAMGVLLVIAIGSESPAKFIYFEF
jgi:D-alanyl-lipoteichoic acid acyltransferase DltB (MBOAT superfamily)